MSIHQAVTNACGADSVPKESRQELPAVRPLLPLVLGALPIKRRFTIFEPVGAGSFATVYRAQDNVLGRIVALKQLHVPLPLLPEIWQRQFTTELRASAALVTRPAGERILAELRRLSTAGYRRLWPIVHRSSSIMRERRHGGSKTRSSRTSG